MSVTNSTSFATACREAISSVLDAIGAAANERSGRLAAAKLAADKAMDEARSGEEWYLAHQLRRGIKEVETCTHAAA